MQFRMEIQPIQLFVCKILIQSKVHPQKQWNRWFGGTFNQLFKNLAGSVIMEYSTGSGEDSI